MNFFQKIKSDTAIIFSFNLLRTVHSSFGLAHFVPIQQLLLQEYEKSELLPIINYDDTNIEKRAQTISKSLPQVIFLIIIFSISLCLRFSCFLFVNLPVVA